MYSEEALDSLDFGSVNSEAEDQLDQVFVKTRDFDKFLQPKVWLILGAKGTGKSALFEYFTKYEKTARVQAGSALDDVVIATGTGFGDLTEIDTNDLQELKAGERGYDHDRLWRLYIAIKAGLALDESFRIPRGALLDLMEAVGKRKDYRVGSLLRQLWVLAIGSAPHDISISLGQGSFELKKGKRDLDVVTILEDVQAALQEKGKELWLLFDKIDEIWPADRDERKKALEGLLTAAMYVRRAFPEIQPIIFLRTDLWAELDFTNKDHLTDKRIELNWNVNHLSNLLVKRALQPVPVRRYVEQSRWGGEIVDIDSCSAEERLDVLKTILPSTAYPGEREAAIMDWLVERVRDGRGTVLPRDAIVLSNYAAEFQRELGSVGSPSLISREAIRSAFTKASEVRCESYLAEFPDLKNHFSRFSGQTKADFSRAELLKLMDGLSPDGNDLLERLFEIGVIRPDTGRVLTANSYEIPRLYRAGLGLVIRGRP